MNLQQWRNSAERTQGTLVEDLQRAMWLLDETESELRRVERAKPKWWRRRARRRYHWRIALWRGRAQQRRDDIDRIVRDLAATSYMFYARAHAWESKRRDRRQAELDRDMERMQAECDAMNMGRDIAPKESP